jgi:hypothetical protein
MVTASYNKSHVTCWFFVRLVQCIFRTVGHTAAAKSAFIIPSATFAHELLHLLIRQ